MPKDTPSPQDTTAQTVTITLSRDGVVAPALRTMRRASEIVAFTLNSLTDADLSESPRPKSGSNIGLQFADEPEGYDRKNDFIDWVLERGFRDLAHGVRASLEEAYLYINLIRDAGKVTIWGEFEALHDLMKKAANRMNFKNLMREVNAGLKEPLAFEEEFLSLQKVRNCLEHRHGIVAEIDVDHPNGMRLALPHTKIFFVKDGQEIEVAVGQYFKKETAISIRLDTRERFFSLGSRVSFSGEEFDEIAMGSWLFASDLASKLPDMAVAGELAGGGK
ncbi:hypothetical protein [Pararhizobium sp.]|uniref:hypothetical protein n=1 Tax=Pararhizobium sp. TaxID=1977563 RepID=UPI003D09F5FC